MIEVKQIKQVQMKIIIRVHENVKDLRIFKGKCTLP